MASDDFSCKTTGLSFRASAFLSISPVSSTCVKEISLAAPKVKTASSDVSFNLNLNP